MQSGRAPVHVNVVNCQPTSYNLEDPVGGFAGIPRNMTTVAQVMKRAGYSTHMVGKVGCFVIPVPASSALLRRQSGSMQAHTHCLARRTACTVGRRHGDPDAHTRRPWIRLHIDLF